MANNSHRQQHHYVQQDYRKHQFSNHLFISTKRRPLTFAFHFTMLLLLTIAAITVFINLSIIRLAEAQNLPEDFIENIKSNDKNSNNHLLKVHEDLISYRTQFYLDRYFEKYFYMHFSTLIAPAEAASISAKFNYSTNNSGYDSTDIAALHMGKKQASSPPPLTLTSLSPSPSKLHLILMKLVAAPQTHMHQQRRMMMMMRVCLTVVQVHMRVFRSVYINEAGKARDRLNVREDDSLRLFFMEGLTSCLYNIRDYDEISLLRIKTKMMENKKSVMVMSTALDAIGMTTNLLKRNMSTPIHLSDSEAALLHSMVDSLFSSVSDDDGEGLFSVICSKIFSHPTMQWLFMLEGTNGFCISVSVLIGLLSFSTLSKSRRRDCSGDAANQTSDGKENVGVSDTQTSNQGSGQMKYSKKMKRK